MPNTEKVFYTLTDVNKYNTKDKCWVVANNNVYDVTNYISRHPGGKFVILSKANVDVSKYFNTHSKGAKELWEKYKIGEILRLT